MDAEIADGHESEELPRIRTWNTFTAVSSRGKWCYWTDGGFCRSVGTPLHLGS